MPDVKRRFFLKMQILTYLTVKMPVGYPAGIMAYIFVQRASFASYVNAHGVSRVLQQAQSVCMCVCIIISYRKGSL